MKGKGVIYHLIRDRIIGKREKKDHSSRICETQEKSVAYYLIRDRIVAKREKSGMHIEDALFRDGRWLKDVDGVVMDHLLGFDPSEPEDSPYRFGSTDILLEMEKISEAAAMSLIDRQVLEIGQGSGTSYHNEER